MADYKYNLNKISPEMAKVLGSYDLNPTDLKSLTKEQNAQIPITKYGASNLEGIAQLPNMVDSTYGATLATKSNPIKTTILLNPNSPNVQETLGHEMEHVLAFQGLPKNENINTKWTDLVEDDPNASRYDVVNRIVEHAPYLVENYGLPKVHAETGYFSKTFIDALKKLGQDPGLLLQEQLATLSSLEQKTGKMLTRDPYVKNNIFTNKNQREAYNALTGLRQSRLDAKDLPPYTKHTDPEDLSTLQKIKKTLGLQYDYKKGGLVDKPLQGGNKLI